jgi:hypothetical protein
MSAFSTQGNGGSNFKHEPAPYDAAECACGHMSGDHTGPNGECETPMIGPIEGRCWCERFHAAAVPDAFEQAILEEIRNVDHATAVGSTALMLRWVLDTYCRTRGSQ